MDIKNSETSSLSCQSLVKGVAVGTVFAKTGELAPAQATGDTGRAVITDHNGIKMNTIKVLAIIALVFFCGISHAAIQHIPTQNGWGGFVVLGAGYTNQKSNTVAGNRIMDIGKESIANINDSPQSDDKYHITPTAELKYTFGNQWQAFLGSSLFDQLTLDFSQQLGIRKQIDNGDRFSAGLLFSGIPRQVWEDPYQTSTPRNATDLDSQGARIEWDQMFGSGANITLSYRDIEIDEDRIGQDPALGCDVNCQNALQRDGDFVELEFAWGFRLSPRQAIRPAIRWFANDRDGSAQDNDGFKALLTWQILGDAYSVILNGLYFDKSYDNPNPLYGIKQDSDGFVLNGTAFYNLTSDGRWRAVGTLTYGDAESNISFHDTELFQATLGVFFQFGNQPNRFRKR